MLLRYALTIFLSAFLLFQVQPMIGKIILPWFGGTPAVWTTCMLFFQTLLLCGYAYAHWLAGRQPRAQAVIHFLLLLVSLACLPIRPTDDWKPTGAEMPTLHILLLLTAAIGVPYFLLSTTGPLLQEWFRRESNGRSPYRLYALSNVGSLLALLTYPFVVEPSLTLGTQTTSWSWAYAVFAVLCGLCMPSLFKTAPSEDAPPAEPATPATQPAPVTELGPEAVERSQTQEELDTAWMKPAPEAPARRPRASDVVMWLLLAAAGSAMLLATTNQMCQEVAVVPFLWILPLALYLLTFIICFDSPMWYVRGIFGVLLGVSAVLVCFILEWGVDAELWQQVAAYSLVMFMACMTCHGEIVRSRPHPKYLTLFYLTISAGGALGGMLVAIVAPLLFTGYWEYQAALGGCTFLTLVAYFRDRNWILYHGRPWWAWLAFGSAWVLLIVTLGRQIHEYYKDSFYLSRNFYGVLRVTQEDAGTPAHKLLLTHGRIMHGFQYQSPDRQHWPTSYYGYQSGLGVAISRHPRRFEPGTDRTLRIGSIGLGAGTTAALGQRRGQGRKDLILFYEINPEVVALSAHLEDPIFTYRKDSDADVKMAPLGDARIVMERELHEGHSQQFDVLAVDAFSSDAIPMHLLTKECAEIYWGHLKPDGLLAIHISNRNMDLKPVVLALAEESGRQAIRIRNKGGVKGVSSAEWIIVTNNETFLNDKEVIKRTSRWPENIEPLLWTDDYGSLRQVLIDQPWQTVLESDEEEEE